MNDRNTTGLRASGKPGQRGFTLIELLVVISIISVLMSILMPSLCYSREIAREIQCRTNQRALGVAVHIYVNDNKGFLPSSETWIEGIMGNIGSSQPESAFDGHSGMVAGREVDSLELSLWPGGAMMSDEFMFWPNLSLPTARENPGFWGPLYTEHR